MSDRFMDRVGSFGRKLGLKMKDFFQGQNMPDQIVEEATSENLDEPDFSINYEICDMINHERVNSIEVIRGIKKRILVSNSARVQYLAMVLLESVVSNCKRVFPEIAAERVFGEMVKVIDDPRTIVNNRNKALLLIKTWEESSGGLPFLHAFEETYKDELTTTIVQQCCSSRKTIQRIIEAASDNDALLFEALNVNDEIQKVLSNYMDMKKAQVLSPGPEPTITAVANDELDDLDKIILGGKSGVESENGQDSKKEQTSKDDLISF